ncbi:MAG TPA: ABC transporter ATP-binding protein [Nitrososphaerales archaeon]|nr:ABC transporter ATP-binding protein [Nitrososphaerales archaeon]
MSQVQLEMSSIESNAVLDIRHLSVTFTKKHGSILRTVSTIKAVNDVSFSLSKGEVLSIVGESGSGKTTLARCIVGFVPPSGGSVAFNGTSISELQKKKMKFFRSNVQMIFQDPYESLNPRHDVLTTISVPLRYLYGERSKTELVEKASFLLEDVGLNPGLVLYRYPHQLSGGERQRVSLARALAPSPQLLIADEPVTMVDAAQRLKILRILADLRTKRNLTILMITHDLASAKIVSDRIAIMYKGNLVELGSSDNVLSSPHHPYVELIRDSMPELQPSSNQEITESPVVELADVSKGCSFRPRCKYATEVCANIVPQLTEISSKHYAACHNPLNKKEN